MTSNRLVVLALATACSGPSLEDGRNPTGSQTVITSSDFRALYVANAEEDTIARIDLADEQVTELAIAGEPTRIARAGGRVIVSLRAKRRIAIFDETASGLVFAQEIEVGAEPYGVVAKEDGSAFYVASSASDLVEEYDGVTLEKVRVWSAPGEPRWLAIHPSGNTLYVASAFGGAVHFVDLRTGRSGRIALPQVDGFDLEGVPVQLTARVTGDPAVAPDGSRLAIPGLYVNNSSPITEDADAEEEGGGYSDRINPVVMLVSVDDNGVPDDEAELAPIKAFDLGSYPASVAFSPDSEMVVAAMEGASSVAIIGSDVPSPPGDAPRTGFFSLVPSEVMKTEAGPRGIAFTEDNSAWIYCFLDRTVSKIEVELARDTVREAEAFANAFDRRTQSTSVVVVAESDLPADVERGRRLFYSSDDLRMTSQGSSVSCGTCHFEGRNDGITWTFERGRRQTPSLAEDVSARAPLRWEGDRATIAIDAMMTAETLMGGSGLTEAEAADIEAFVNSIRSVDLPLKGSTDPEIELGRSIFFRGDVGCGTCHGGVLYSDLALHDLLGFNGVKTPSLLGVAATAPYFHDGSAQTLRDVLLRSRTGAMGNTGSLSDVEIDALARFLQTL